MLQPLIHSFTPESLQNKAAKAGAERIKAILATEPLLLLLSGGSAIQMYQEMFGILERSLADWSNLTVSLLDERFVSVDSPDSNASQLKAAGVIKLLEQHEATWIPYLTGEVDGKTVARAISKKINFLLQTNACLIMAGIGPDGHTAGLLPTADENTVNKVFGSSNTVVYYELPADTDNPHRQRLTFTPAGIAQADEAIAYVPGKAKKAAIERFLAAEESIPSCPSLALQLVGESLQVLTDAIWF